MTELNVVANPTGVTPSESEARDRIALILCYLSTLITNAQDDLEDATANIRLRDPGGRALSDGFSALAMAKEYLGELETLEDRPTARAHQTVPN